MVSIVGRSCSCPLRPLSRVLGASAVTSATGGTPVEIEAVPGAFSAVGGAVAALTSWPKQTSACTARDQIGSGAASHQRGRLPARQPEGMRSAGARQWSLGRFHRCRPWQHDPTTAASSSSGGLGRAARDGLPQRFPSAQSCSGWPQRWPRSRWRRQRAQWCRLPWVTRQGVTGEFTSKSSTRKCAGDPILGDP